MQVLLHQTWVWWSANAPTARLCHRVLPPYFRKWNATNRRKFRSETSDNMDSWKAEVRRVRREKIRRKKMRRERVRRKKMQMREKVGTSRFTVFFQWFVAPEGRKVGSLKRRVRSQLARWEMKKCTPLWREAHFQVKMHKTHQVRTTFGSWDVEKVHAVVARSTFPSENVQNTPAPDHFWKLRCRKRARRCGAKHICKSKCTKHTILGPLLYVAMSKKCTPLWREAHFQVKMYKAPHVRTTFGSWDVEKVHAVVARSTFRSQNVQNTPCSVHFWRLRCRLSKKCTPLWREAHFQVKMYKTHHSRTTFVRCDVEKVHAVVARSTFPSENVQSTTCSDHFWRLRCRLSKKCTPLWREAHFEVKMYKTHHVRSSFGGSDVDFRKSARRCGAKHISKSKCTKHTMFGPLLEAQMSTFEKVHAVVARSTFPSQNVTNTRVSDHFWRFSCRFASLHSKNLHYTTWHYTTLRAVAAGTCSADRQMDREIDRLIDR